ncbi:hypothetical protein LM602_02520 [Candidatus Acetothermia bacterium]|nr:hypothetical protein [Candidatus Acetothermia bacterium]MCI2431417.1 hypothetical protein [Candidatus Acetothermia bacterium]MCI2436184.1 hypothetical protein [Candidatus Acetothermia bacterium]
MSVRTLVGARVCAPLLTVLWCGVWAFVSWAAPAPPKRWVELSSRDLSLFVAAGAEAIESVQFQVFDLSGRRIFNSGMVQGAAYYKWYFNRNDKQFISNGVYLYLLTTRVGKASYTMVGKVAVRR